MFMNQRLFALLSVAPLFGACTQTPTPVATPSLRAAGDVSILCAAPDSDGNYQGRPVDACPDYLAQESRKLYALVTQQETGEVAVVDASYCQDGGTCTGGVLDLEHTQPGINFLPVGAEPLGIASTPGGAASFVGVRDTGREGIFALPTRCIGPRPEGEAIRDLRMWPACRLPAAPSNIEVIVDQERATACSGAADTDSASTQKYECSTDLSREFGPKGRRKLLVLLPDLGQLVTIDAQQLLDRKPGSFDACPIEQTLSFKVELPDEQPALILPDDLKGADESCLPKPSAHMPPSASFVPLPTDIALEPGRAYVADTQAPVVHVLDTSDACGLKELAPLLPTSYARPGAPSVTRRVAVSPETSRGKKFLYAVDDSEDSNAGSVMIFDLSPGAKSRTPLLRPGSLWIPTEPPDRIQFGQEVRDIEFVHQDQPLASDGVAVEGVQCDPDPKSNGLGTSYQPDGTDYGPSPSRLRGTFAALALESGYVNIIDVEDLDAACRRPRTTNALSDWDAYGCSNDTLLGPLERAGTPSVTDELSCRLVEPHRARAAFAFDTSEVAGGNAPFLRSFPQLRAKDGSSLAVDQSERGKLHPRMLGVNFKASPDGATDQGDALLYVGATLYTNQDAAQDRLEIDPADAQRNSVVLPFWEPRAYPNGGVSTVTFEGVLRTPSDASYEVVASADLGPQITGLPEQRYGVFRGGVNAHYCESGVEDAPLMAERSAHLNPALSSDELAVLGKHYADTVQITTELLDEDDSYWDKSPGKTCGAAYQSAKNAVVGHKLCELFFGTQELPDAHREMQILRAFSDRLVVDPKAPKDATEREAALDLVACCFPGGVDVQVRATDNWIVGTNGSISHKIKTNPDTLACEQSCDPVDTYRESRVFEISCAGDDCKAPGGELAIGPSAFSAADADSASNLPSRVCVLDKHPVGGVQPGAGAGACIYPGLTARFALYRGLAPSERDMQFSWSTVGGFSPFSVDLYQASNRRVSMPEKVIFVPAINRLIVAEGGASGLFFLGLKNDDGAPGLSFGVAQ